jgi:endonuclease G
MTKMRNIIVAVALATVLCGCEKPAVTAMENSVVLNGNTELSAGHEGTFAILEITSGEEWSIGIVGTDSNYPYIGGEMWAKADKYNGQGSASVSLSCMPNTDEMRSVQVTVQFATSNTVFDITQAAASVIEGNSATFNRPTEISYEELYNDAFINISSEETWSISITDEATSAAPDWLTADPLSGNGNAQVSVKNTVNLKSTERTATIAVKFPDKEKSFTIRQDGATIQTPDMPGWTELPEFESGEGLYFIAHYVDVNGNRVRNYSMCYDAQLYGSYWVAYPIHKSYEGDIDRTNDWGYDPEIASSLQFRYHDLAFGSNNYDRGHQLPSADRTATREMNEQTFHSTNLTPQRWRLNQQRWVQLEDWFRTQAVGAAGQDTVWMVTGAHYSDNPERITNRNNPDRTVAIPAAYYKVAIKKKADTYTGIAFWQENVDTDRSPMQSSDAKTIRDIEELTGINFFNNIPSAQQNVFENAVVPTDWIW